MSIFSYSVVCLSIFAYLVVDLWLLFGLVIDVQLFDCQSLVVCLSIFACLVVDLWSVVFGMCRVYHSVSLNPACRQATRLGTHRSNPHIDTFVFGPLLQSENQVGFDVIIESNFLMYETISQIHTLHCYIDFGALLLIIVKGTWFDLRWDHISELVLLKIINHLYQDPRTIGIHKQELLNR